MDSIRQNSQTELADVVGESVMGQLERDGQATAVGHQEHRGSAERETWGNKLDFLLSCIGYAVGLGNVWRFPFLCYKNGGGAFLIPYLIMLFFAGLPLFFMELAFGQFASLGPLPIWRVSPLFKGIGYGMVTISSIVGIYYNIIITYTVYFFFASFTSELPWSHCRNDFNTPACYNINGTKVSERKPCDAEYEEQLSKKYMGYVTCENGTVKPRSPAEEFFDRKLLDISESFSDVGPVKWDLALTLLFSWLVVFFCIIRGVRSSGKVVYFTAIFPYVVLLILFIKGLTLPGASKGVLFYITPRFELLLSAQVWIDAAVQIFYSLGPGWGSDAVLVSCINCGTSIFAGFVIFSMMGFMSYKLGVGISDVVTEGPGLAFVVYPEGIAQMPAAPLWAVLFFFMLFTLGLDSQFVMVETVISGIVDEYPDFLRPRKLKFTIGLCIVFYLLGLPMITRGGMYLLTIVNNYAGGISLLVIAVCESLVLSWVYRYHGDGIKRPARRFSDDVASMIGSRPNWYWVICWSLVTPFIIGAILVFQFVKYEPLKYGDYVYPTSGEVLGWMLSLTSIVLVPGYAIYKFTLTAYNMGGIREGLSACDLLQELIQPDLNWGPAHQQLESPSETTGPAVIQQPTEGSSLRPARAGKSASGETPSLYTGTAASLGNVTIYESHI